MSDEHNVIGSFEMVPLMPYVDHGYDEGCKCWAVSFPELPGCIAQGATLSEAVHRLKDLVPQYLKAVREITERHYPGTAEVVRAWVARDQLWPATGLYLTEPQPRNTGNDLFWVSEGRWIELPSYWFPTLAPGECWPVEIRRVKE